MFDLHNKRKIQFPFEDIRLFYLPKGFFFMIFWKLLSAIETQW